MPDRPMTTIPVAAGLVWSDHPRLFGDSQFWDCNTDHHGDFCIRLDPGEDYNLISEDILWKTRMYPALDAAKAAAQADYESRICAALSPETLARLALVEQMAEALRWYGEQSRLARLIHSEGDSARHAIQADGGKRARAILAELEKTNG